MGLATVIESETHFQTEMANAGTKLVVVDFTATWCPPCQRIAPFFEQLPAKFPRAVFLKVDVGRCAETASAQGVSAMPTFIFYRNRTRIDQLQGADPGTLETKVRQYYGTDEAGDEDTVAGHMDLVTFITKSECECLNEADNHPMAHCLTSAAGYLASDCDEQLIINISFNQLVKLHSLKIKAPSDKGPKMVKIFINQPRTLDFDQAAGNMSVQDLEFTPSDLDAGNPVPLKFVKFQSVQNIQLFIKDNQTGNDVTQIDHLAFYGSPISTTNMGEFKRVAGKKGESH